jgi:hypothetical protein
MAKSLLYFTCPDPKCGNAGYVELENDDGKVVSHCTTHNAPQAMFDRALESDLEVICHRCKIKIEFETETITVLKAVKYDPILKLNSTTQNYIANCDLAGGQDHMKVIAEHPQYVALMDRELQRLDSTHLAREWKIRIAGKWLRSFITTWVKSNKSGKINHMAVEAEYTQLMSSYIAK